VRVKNTSREKGETGMDNIIIADILSRLQSLENGQAINWKDLIASIPALIAAFVAYLKAKTAEINSNSAIHEKDIDIAEYQCEIQHEPQYEPLAKKINPSPSVLGIAPTEFQAEEQPIKSGLERLFNAYENGCKDYFSKKINRERFKSKYGKSIIDYAEKYSNILGRYESISKFYKELRK